MIITLKAWTKSSDLDILNVISRLNNWCGYDLWNHKSKISEKQILLFNDINWSKENITFPNILRNAKGNDLIKYKVPKEYHKIPTSANITDIIIKLNFYNYLSRESLTKRINNVIKEQIKINLFFYLDKDKKVFSKQKCTFWIMTTLLDVYKGDDLYDEKNISRLIYNYFIENQIVESNQNLLNKMQKLKLSINYKIVFDLTIDEFYDFIFKNKNVNIQCLLDVISYYYNFKFTNNEIEIFIKTIKSLKIYKSELATYFVLLLNYIELTQNKSFVKKYKLDIYDPSKSHSIFAKLQPMGNK